MEKNVLGTKLETADWYSEKHCEKSVDKGTGSRLWKRGGAGTSWSKNEMMEVENGWKLVESVVIRKALHK